jgi:DNA-directed RNA polymerase subunit RPC12/RpoP
MYYYVVQVIREVVVMSGVMTYRCTECGKGELVPHISFSMTNNKLHRVLKCNKCSYTKSY